MKPKEIVTKLREFLPEDISVTYRTRETITDKVKRIKVAEIISIVCHDTPVPICRRFLFLRDISSHKFGLEIGKTNKLWGWFAKSDMKRIANMVTRAFDNVVTNKG